MLHESLGQITNLAFDDAHSSILALMIVCESMIASMSLFICHHVFAILNHYVVCFLFNRTVCIALPSTSIIIKYTVLSVFNEAEAV